MIYLSIIQVSTILFNCILLGLFVESITELLTKDEILDSFRELVIRFSPGRVEDFVASILTCGRCASGWVSLVLLLLFIVSKYILGAFFSTQEPVSNTDGLINNLSIAFELFLCWFLTWRSANIWHFLIDRLDRRKK
jgi:hypothetical protein